MSREVAYVSYKNSCGTWRAKMHYEGSSNPVANSISFYNRFEEFVRASDFACRNGLQTMRFRLEVVEDHKGSTSDDEITLDPDDVENREFTENF